MAGAAAVATRLFSAWKALGVLETCWSLSFVAFSLLRKIFLSVFSAFSQPFSAVQFSTRDRRKMADRKAGDHKKLSAHS